MINDGRQHLRDLLSAYVEVTGLAVAWTWDREKVLRELDRRGVSPDEVRAVLVVVKRHMARGTFGYTEASLDFRNAMKPDAMEERVLKVRQAKGRTAGAKRERAAGLPRAETVPSPAGGTVSRIEPPRGPAPEVPPVDGAFIAEEMRRFREKMGRGA